MRSTHAHITDESTAYEVRQPCAARPTTSRPPVPGTGAHLTGGSLVEWLGLPRDIVCGTSSRIGGNDERCAGDRIFDDDARQTEDLADRLRGDDLRWVPAAISRPSRIMTM
jgi:hypothetical protein